VKKSLLIIIDALTSRIVQSELKAGNLPTMQKLIDAGHWRDLCTAIFPSLTLAATPSITTGRYPFEHGMMGAYWYDKTENRVVYFGGDPWMVMRQGPGRFLTDFLVNLNHHWLRSDTIFEKVEAQGKSAASLNWFVYHGNVKHEIDMALLDIVPNAPGSTEIYGPSTLHLGNFTNVTETLGDEEITVNGHPFNRFGFKDEVTGKLLAHIAEEKAFSDFTLAYFPDNDFNSHEVGPANAVETLHKVDGYLEEMITAYGGIDAFLDDIAIVITGDHSQSDIVDDEEKSAINLEDILNEFKVSEVGKGWTSDEEIIICPNGRAASFYLRDPSQKNINAVIEQLLQDERIDQVMCHGMFIKKDDNGFHVFTQDRGKLQFKAAQSNSMAQDRYGGQWQWSGELGVFGKSDQQDKVITFEDYPNAFERISMLLGADRSGQIWASAHIGYDFVIPGIEAHTGGGSHGALHYLDSSPPLIAAGVPDDITIPDVPRSVDLVPLCLQVLGLSDPAFSIGQNRIRETK